MTDTENKPISSPPPEDTIGDRIREKRKELDFTVEQLAELTAMFDYETEDADKKGISSPTLYRYESRGSKPSAREMRLLCYALNVSPNWLLLGKEWNRTQDDDSKMAETLRALFKQVNFSQAMPDGNFSRNESHRIKVLEIKNRTTK